MKVAMLVAAALVLTPMAYAQPSCKDINTIIAETPNSFHAFQGEERDPDYYDSEFWLEDAVECSVDVSVADIFYCVWANAIPAAANYYTSLATQMKSCLPGWREADVSGQTAMDGTLMTKGAKFGSPIGNPANAIVTVYLAPRADKQTSEVWFVLMRSAL